MSQPTYIYKTASDEPVPPWRMGLSQLFQNVMRAKKFAVCFINVRIKKKVLVRKHARSEAPLCERCAMICNRSGDISYVLVGSLCNKSENLRWSGSIVRVLRWSDERTCVNAKGRTANIRSCKPSCVCSHMSLGYNSCSCSLIDIHRIRIIRWGGIGAAALESQV